MKVGDLVRDIEGEYIGIVTHIDPEEIGDDDEVMVVWFDGDATYHSVQFLERLNETG